MVLILSVLIGITLDFSGAKPAVKYYASKYDHIDVEAILNNRRMVNYYSACLLSKGPCPPEGIEFKRILPEALKTNCARCSEKQTTVTLRTLRRLQKEYPKIWNQLSQQWDPDDIYVKKFESTFGTQVVPHYPHPDSPATFNRFDAGDENTDNAIDATFITTTAKVITSKVTNASPNNDITTTTLSTTLPQSSIMSITTKPISTTRTSTTSSTAIGHSTTTMSVVGGIPFNTFFTNPPIPIRPLVSLNIGANIGATVSGLFRGLGAIGTRVVETGAEIADVVIKNFARPLENV